MFKRLLLLALALFVFACAPAPLSGSPAATPNPTLPRPWWREAVFYEIFVRSFYDSNGDGIGDFNGITAKLDYLKDLGVNALWLMPINPSPSYHGYDVTDYYSVNPQYGSMDDFKHLLAEAHSRGMHLIIDLVLNHTSDQHPNFVDANNDPSSPYRDWYIWSDSSQGSYWHPGKTGFYFGIFCDCMPDLNYRNPAVTAEMEKVVRYWLQDIGVDGFRLDAANRLIEEGNKTENTSSTHEWLKGFYTSYKSDNPNAYAVGEVYGAGSSLVKSYTGDQLDQAFDFELATSILNSANGGSNAAIDSALTFAQQDLPDGNYASFLTNHDQNRVMSTLSGNIQKARLSAFLLLTSPGTPYLYYGEEIGMQGEKPDEDIRRPMQWSSATNAGFSTGTPWRAPAVDFTTVNVSTEENDPASLLNLYKQLINLRQQHPALTDGSLILPTTNNPAVFASLRLDPHETLLILANLKGQAISGYNLTLARSGLQPGNVSLVPIFGSGTYNNLSIGSNGAINGLTPLPELPPYSMMILKLLPLNQQ